MSIADWATTISGFLAVLLAAGGALRWLIKHYLSELKKNGGGSVKDRTDLIPKVMDMLNDIHDDLLGVKIDLARLEGKFEQHVEEHKR